jgi:hypothetical protein
VPSGSVASTSTTAVVFSATLCEAPDVNDGASLTLVTVMLIDCAFGLVPSVAVTWTR